MGKPTQLNPTTLPRRFQISQYGGSNPTARRISATIPTTVTPIALPPSYSGYFVKPLARYSTHIKWQKGPRAMTCLEGQDQSCLDAREEAGRNNTHDGPFQN